MPEKQQHDDDVDPEVRSQANVSQHHDPRRRDPIRPSWGSRSRSRRTASSCCSSPSCFPQAFKGLGLGSRRVVAMIRRARLRLRLRWCCWRGRLMRCKKELFLLLVHSSYHFSPVLPADPPLLLCQLIGPAHLRSVVSFVQVSWSLSLSVFLSFCLSGRGMLTCGDSDGDVDCRGVCVGSFGRGSFCRRLGCSVSFGLV